MARLRAFDPEWYDSLAKPSYVPPRSVFTPAWLTLYGLMAISGYRLYRAPRVVQRRNALLLGAAHLALNLAWTPIFFGAHRPRLALANIVAQDATLVALLRQSRSIDRLATRLLYPLAGWLGFASLLNFEIARRNPVTRSRASGPRTPERQTERRPAA